MAQPRPALVEIVEPVDHQPEPGDVCVPREIRVNGVPLLIADTPIVSDMGDSANTPLTVTMTVFARRVVAGFQAPAVPTIGRIVHYTSYGTPGGEYGSECRAAIVTEVGETEVNETNPAGDGAYRQTVSLAVLNPSGTFHNHGVLHDPERAGGTWHWPDEH